MKTERPNCPKCKKLMYLMGTGITTEFTLRVFHCAGCKETKTVKEDKDAVYQVQGN